MRKIREILRLRYVAGLSIRQIKASTKLSVGAIQQLLSKANALGLTWPLPPKLDGIELARRFYPGADTRISRRYQVPEWPVIHQELKRKDSPNIRHQKGLTQAGQHVCSLARQGVSQIKPRRNQQRDDNPADKHTNQGPLAITSEVLHAG